MQLVLPTIHSIESRRRPSPDVPPTVTLYRRQHCSLCDDALFELRALGDEMAFTIVERDIDDDPELRLRYDEIVPVIAVDDTDIAHAPIEFDELRGVLEWALGSVTG